MSQAVIATVRPRETILPFAVSFAFQTGRRKLTWSSSVANDSPSSRVEARAIPIAASARSHRIPPWRVPIGFAWRPSATYPNSAVPSPARISVMPSAVATGGGAIRPLAYSSTFFRILRTSRSGPRASPNPFPRSLGDEDLNLRVGPGLLVRPRVARIDFPPGPRPLDRLVLLPPAQPIGQSMVDDPRRDDVGVEGHGRDRRGGERSNAHLALSLDATSHFDGKIEAVGLSRIFLGEEPLSRVQSFRLRPLRQSLPLGSDSSLVEGPHEADRHDSVLERRLDCEVNGHGVPPGLRRPSQRIALPPEARLSGESSSRRKGRDRSRRSPSPRENLPGARSSPRPSRRPPCPGERPVPRGPN